MAKVVLIAEDDEDWQDIFREDLTRWGHISIPFTKSDEVIKAITGNLKYDLAILDIELKGASSGLEVMAESKKYNPSIPVIIVSGWPRARRFANGKLEFFNIGAADGYICKGVYDEQRDTIEKYLR